MEKNEPETTEEWVDRKLKSLALSGEWQPDPSRGLSRLRETHTISRPFLTRRGASVLAVLVITAAYLIAFPRARVGVLRTLAISGSVRAASLVPEKDRKAAIDFGLKDSAGKLVKLSDLRGRVVLLNFWATWCHGCGLEVPWFVDFQAKYGSQGLAVLGVSLDSDGWSVVNRFAAEKKINYRLVIDDARVAERYRVGPMPMTLVIDRNGKIAATHLGVVPREDCESEIQTLLRETTGSAD